MASPCLPTRIGLLAVVALLAVFPRRGSAAGCDGRASGCTVFAKAKDVREKVETLALETAAKISLYPPRMRLWLSTLSVWRLL